MTTTPKASHHTAREKSYRAVLLGALTAGIAVAQTANAPTPEVDETPASPEIYHLDKFTTTGSAIKRTDVEKVLPVTIFFAEQIESRDSATSMDLLQGIPQITNIPANETSLNAVAARGANAAAALRGIGAQNTLVLLNGRRMPFNPIAGTNISTVNINALPTVGLSQIEVLRDGASSVYGADAVAGVINYITNKNINGGTISIRAGVTEHGGGNDVSANFLVGESFAEGRGRFTAVLGLYSRDSILHKEREISENTNRLHLARAPWNVAAIPYDGRSLTTNYPSFRVGNNAVSGTVHYLNPTANGGAVLSTSRPRDLYDNYNALSTASPMSNRANLYTQFEYDLNDRVTFFGDFTGFLAESKLSRQAVSLSSGDARVVLSADNPFNPRGSAFYDPAGANGKILGNPQPITINGMLMHESGGETVLTADRLYRVLAGARGKFGDANQWEWETAAMLGGYRFEDEIQNAIRESLLKQSALRTGADAWNPFGYTFKIENGDVVPDQPYRNPQAVTDYFTEPALRVGHSRLASFDARVGGPVLDLWAGPLSTSIGGEWRYEQKADWKAPYVSMNPPDDPTLDPNDNDILVTSPKANYNATRRVMSAYAEVLLPLISDRQGLSYTKDLELSASVRYENYSDFGESINPKFGINWRPISRLMLRGSFNKGFRAPDLASMNQPASFTVATPPGNVDLVRDQFFRAAGMSPDANVIFRNYTQPNPNLKPEKSQGISGGFVLEVPKIKGLSVSVDYWEIEQTNLIYTQTRVGEDDRALLHAYTQQQLAAGKNIFDIDVGSRLGPGAHNYVGDPYTIRAAVTPEDIALFTQAYAVLPQSQWIAPLGGWLGTTQQEVNSQGRAFTNGFDYEVDYNLPRTSTGSWRFTATWSHFLNKYQKDTDTDPRNDDIIAMLTPKWRASANVQWKRQNWGATLNATYSSAIRTNAQTTEANYLNAGSPYYIMPVFNDGRQYFYETGHSTLQLNLGVSYKFNNESNRWLRDTTVRLGINNLLDEQPPLVVANEAGSGANAAGYSGANGSSLYIGRAYSLTFTRSF
jgi:iron complex outermembrane receptor protein